MVLFIQFLPHGLTAQTRPVTFEGRVNLSSEFYDASGIKARRPSSISRAILQPTVTLFDQVVLPFEIYVSTEDRGFRQPFNQFGVSPRLFGWMTLHAGYYSARLSDLTFGDSRLLGGGAELTPGSFRFSFLYGRSQQAIAPDTANGFVGTYKRTVWAGRVGVGRQNDLFFDLHLLRAVDDTASVVNPPRGLTPKENAVASIAFGIPLFGPDAHASAEVAVSAFSNDTRSEEQGKFASRLRWLFTARTSSQVDGAAKLALRFTFSPAVGLTLNARWIGPGFVTLGYQQLQNDIFDVTIGPSVRLLENKLHVRGSFGLRFNNLRNNRLATTRRTIGTANITVQPSQSFAVDVQYSNYGLRSTPKNDTLRIDNITQSISVAPRYTFPSFEGTSTLMASYSYQNFSDNNIVTSSRNGKHSHAASATWSLGLPSTLSFGTRVGYNLSSASAVKVRVITVGETVGHQFFDKKMSVSATVGYSVVKATASSGQLQGGLNASYSLDKWGRFSLSFTASQFNDNDPLTDALYREMIGRLQYSYAF